MARAANIGAWSAGRGLLLGRGVDIEVYGTLRLGDRVHLADGAYLAVAPGAILHIDDDTFVGRGTVIVATQSIVVGKRVLIAEHCSIRDGDHALAWDVRAVETTHQSTPIVIQDHVWIAAGVRVLRGSVLSRGCVVAANAVVRGQFASDVVVGGIPARVLKRVQPSGVAREGGG
jgi:acetyltransferase-like isoleucine patch superfamily enzyme